MVVLRRSVKPLTLYYDNIPTLLQSLPPYVDIYDSYRKVIYLRQSGQLSIEKCLDKSNTEAILFIEKEVIAFCELLCTLKYGSGISRPVCHQIKW